MSTCCSSKGVRRALTPPNRMPQQAASGLEAPALQKRPFWFWVCLSATWGVLLIAVTVLLHAGVSWATPEPGIQLSRGTACTSVKPRAAISTDGIWLAAVWIEGDASSGRCRDSGSAVLGRAQRTAETYSWQTPQTIMEGQANESSACVTQIAMQLRGTTAHLLTTQRTPCLGESLSSIHYFTCDLTTGTCTAPESVIADAGANQSIVNAELSLDDTGAPHVVYNVSGEVYYVRKINGSWQEAPGTNLSTAIWIGGVSVDYAAYAPRVASSGDRLHVVWDAQVPGGKGIPVYRYCHTNDGSCPAAGGPRQLNPQWEGDMGTYSLPVIAARDNRVLTIWHYCTEDPFEPLDCNKFQLIYSRSDDNGDTFIPPQESKDAVGGIYPYNPGSGSPSTDASTATYNNQLQPALVLDANGYPWVAWHAATNSSYSAYMITTTVATAQTGLAFNWQYRPGWSIGENDTSRARVNPLLLIPQPAATSGAHLVYMAKNASGSGNYQVYYSYLQEATSPTTTPTESPTSPPTETPAPTETPPPPQIYLPLVLKGN